MKSYRRGYLLFFFLIFISSCNSMRSHQAIQMIGFWRSSSGYSVEIKKDGTYQFCSDADCGQGIYSMPYGNGSSALILRGLFKLRIADRFKTDLVSLGVFSGKLERDYPDFDFTPNMGVNEYQIGPSECGGEPCVYKGSVEDFENGITFVKE